MTTTPPTPSATWPVRDSELRFHETSFPSEWVESYRPGGFHPVNLGDSFKNGQYRVIRKLGYGSFSTVWLASDKLNHRYVALKVMDAKLSAKNDQELSILKRIKNSRAASPRAKHILEYLDQFQHVGPSGTHTCLVSEPMGPTAASLVDELTQFKHHTFGTKIRYPKAMAKTILRHTLLGLAFLQENDIVHADLQPGNLLFAISDIDSLPEEELKQDRSGQDPELAPEPIRRLDGAEDKWAPRYLFLDQSLTKYTHLGPEMRVVISDFGAAFWAHDPPSSTVTPLALRSPELILGDKIDRTIDMWSFGCLIYELLTGLPLFSVIKFFKSEEESADDDHLLQLNDKLEPLPDSWLRDKWPRASQYFGPNRERLDPNAVVKNDVDHDDQAGLTSKEGDIAEGPGPEQGDGSGSFIDSPLEEQFRENKPDDIDDEEAVVITSLIRSILKFEPSQRPSAADILQHSWFQQ